MSEKVTTYNLIGKVKLAVQRGTEEVDLAEKLREQTVILVEGDGFEGRIDITPNLGMCRIWIIVKEKVGYV
ncbi:MAG: hypothetical protein DRP02_12365 [Candidatus Gerdarchaeota archaeon]|nr:MAG: hypothetical protein DRP02_12365 [Candidatus Gerdarchaeota archaeon]